MLNPIPNVRGSGYDVIKKLRFRERKFALFFKHELPPPDCRSDNLRLFVIPVKLSLDIGYKPLVDMRCC